MRQNENQNNRQASQRQNRQRQAENATKMANDLQGTPFIHGGDAEIGNLGHLNARSASGTKQRSGQAQGSGVEFANQNQLNNNCDSCREDNRRR